MLDLKVGERRMAARAPVDKFIAAINKTIIIKCHKHFAHCPRTAVIHGKALAAPVAGRAELHELLDYRAAGLVLPLPHALDEFFAAHIKA